MLFLLRHGRVEGAELKRFIGQTDVPLSQEGLDQAKYWAQAFKKFSALSIHSSCLTRCRKTAAIISAEVTKTSQTVHYQTLHAQNIQASPALNEIHLGQWENQPFDHIKKTKPAEFARRGEHIGTYRPPGGESFSDVSHRAVPYFLSTIEKAQPHTLIVTHAGVIRVLLCHIQQIPVDHLFDFKPAYSELIAIDPSNSL